MRMRLTMYSKFHVNKALWYSRWEGDREYRLPSVDKVGRHNVGITANVCTLQIKVSKHPRNCHFCGFPWTLFEPKSLSRQCRLLSAQRKPGEDWDNFISCNGQRLIFMFICLNVQCPRQLVRPLLWLRNHNKL